MVKVNFTREFYQKVYDAFCEYGHKYFDCPEDRIDSGSVSTVFVDGYEIEADVEYECEFEDKSFDHAFGTWHDPFAGWVFSDIIGIEGNVTVWDKNGDEVEGFSIDDYDKSFIEEEHDGIKKGDKVVIYEGGRYSDDVYEVLFFESRERHFVLQGEKRKKCMSRSRIKKVA